MFYTLKPLVVVMGIALIVFTMARPWCLRFMSPEDYVRRRNVWLTLTVVAFASPSFWVYAVVALVLLAWAAQKDSNPLALYVTMLHVVPPIGFYIPMVGINQLFQLNNYRILSLAVLLPLAVRVFRSPPAPSTRTRLVMDCFLVAFLLLQLALLVPYESFTNTLRRGFLLTLDIVLVYYVFSRGCVTRRVIHDVMAALCLTCAIFAAIAVFETAKGWLLYQSLGDHWGQPIEFAWLMRGDALRSQASLGHALLLGYMLAMGFGFMLYLAQTVRSRSVASVLAAWLWLGLLAAYSRGPWLVAAIAFFTFVALQPAGMARFVKYGFLAVVGVAGVLLSPWGGRVIASLPMIGTVDLETVEYRRRLADVSWQLIQQNPLLGNPFVLTQMEELRQGQGIIDLVNSYASTALLYGVPGLVLFVGVFAGALTTVWRMQKRWSALDLDVTSLGACLVGCLLGTLVMLAVASFGQGLAWMSWILAGMAAGYGNLQEDAQPLAPAEPVPEVPPALPPGRLRPSGWVRTGV
jgi:hypothetical protein